MAKRIPAASVGAPMDESTVTTSTMLELGIFGTARDDANVSSLKGRISFCRKEFKNPERTTV